MSRGFAFIAELYSGFSLTELVESFETIGVRLKNQSSQRITKLSSIGEQIFISEDELCKIIKGYLRVTFQFWLSDDTDICCTFQRLSDNVALHIYSFDGLDRSEIARMRQWTIGLFKKKACHGNAVLFIVDLWGITQDYEWQEFLEEKGKIPVSLPEIIGVSNTMLAKLPDMSMYEPYIISDSTLFISREDLDVHQSRIHKPVVSQI
jgi:hypothetical protein